MVRPLSVLCCLLVCLTLLVFSFLKFARASDLPSDDQGDKITLLVHAPWAPTQEGGVEHYWKWQTELSSQNKPLLKVGSAHLIEAQYNCSSAIVSLKVAGTEYGGTSNYASHSFSSAQALSQVTLIAGVQDPENPAELLADPQPITVAVDVAEASSLASNGHDGSTEGKSFYYYFWEPGQVDTWTLTLAPAGIGADDVPNGFDLDWNSTYSSDALSDGDNSLQKTHTITGPAQYTITVQ